MTDLELLHEGLKGSGFPFELEIASALTRLGYDVRPSTYFLDRDRGKDTEVDLVASKQFEFSTRKIPKISTTLRLVVECKDTAYRFICLGLPVQPKGDPKSVDLEVFTPHFRTSRDKGMKGRFNVILFHPRGKEEPRRIRHHHYIEDIRYHSIVIAEEVGKGNQRRYRVSTPDKMRHALAKLGSFVGLSDQEELSDQTLEQLAEGPYLNVLYSVLVHPGEHFRYVHQTESLQPASHTPVFLSRSYLGQALYYVVDVVSADELPAAVGTMESSFSALVERVVPYMLA